MNELELTKKIEQFAREKFNVPLFGTARTENIDFHPEIAHTKAVFPFAIIIGYKVLQGVTRTLIDGPNKLYFAHYRQLNYLLDRATNIISQEIESSGFLALPIPASQTVDWNTQEGHISHRHIAVESGLAFWGRNNLAITPQFGAHQRWASILTNMPLVSGERLNMDCGECRACVSSCPAGAIGETREQFKIDLCLAKLKEFTSRGIGHYICGMCIKPCVGKGKQSQD